MIKRLLALTLSALLLCGALAGCSGTDAGTSAPASTAATSTADQSTGDSSDPAPAATGYNGADNLQVAEEPTTVSLFYAFGANGAPTADMPIFQKAAEITNVSIDNMANPSISDDIQSLNTMLAGGSLPDIIHGQVNNLRGIITQGAFISLDELIEEHAPNIKRFLDENAEARATGTGPDGQIYYITGTLGGQPGQYLPSMGWYIRQDWLDKLNMEIPETFEDFEKVLYAFREQDPNGNGQKDEIPFLYRDLGIHVLLSLFGVGGNYNGYFADDSGQVQFSLTTPEYKEALKHLSKWYADGIIDPEIFTRGSQARQELFGNDTGGCTMDWFASTGGINSNPDIIAAVPDMNLVPMLPPTGTDGKQAMTYCRAPIHSYAWGISKDCADPVTVIKYMDFWFSETGYLLHGYGIEGVDYELVDGEPVITEEAINKPETYPVYMRSIGNYEIGAEGQLDGELTTMNEQAKDGFELYLNSDVLVPTFPPVVFNEDEADMVARVTADIFPIWEEYQQKAVMGTINVDDTWDKYISDLNAVGLEELMVAYNAAYQRYMDTLE